MTFISNDDAHDSIKESSEAHTALSYEKIWDQIRDAAQSRLANEPALSNFTRHIVLSSQDMAQGLGRLLSHQQLDSLMTSEELESLFSFVLGRTPQILDFAAADLEAVCEQDPAATDFFVPFLYFKGFHALQMHRVAHWLWGNGREDMALFLQNRSSILYGIDIHPAAQLGKRIMFDHATGIVIGETAVVEDDVSLFHGVTLGGTGKERKDRHPKIRRGAMVGAGSILLGNIEIGHHARIAAGSVVLKDVRAHATAAGSPAKEVRINHP